MANMNDGVSSSEKELFELFVVGHNCNHFREHTQTIHFKPGGGIGIVVQAKCSCGAEEDITDYSCW